MTFVKRIEIDEYAKIDAEHYSTLKFILRSPRHYIHAIRSEGPRKPTPPMILGLAAHCAVLEPHIFQDEFAVWGEGVTGRSPVKRGEKWNWHDVNSREFPKNRTKPEWHGQKRSWLCCKKMKR